MRLRRTLTLACHLTLACPRMSPATQLTAGFCMLEMKTFVLSLSCGLPDEVVLLKTDLWEMLFKKHTKHSDNLIYCVFIGK